MRGGASVENVRVRTGVLQNRFSNHLKSIYFWRTVILLLDALHIFVAEGERRADLVDRDVAHEVAEVFTRLAPVIEDRAAIKEDCVRMRQRIAEAFMRQGDAAIEAH